MKKVNEKIQKFKFQKKRELKKHESHIERSKISKERISSKIITFNQQLNAEVSLSKEFEAALKDKILITRRQYVQEEAAFLAVILFPRLSHFALEREKNISGLNVARKERFG